jgi:hypothetical protein
MGLYNYNIDQLPAPLNQNHCIICGGVIRPYNKDPELDGFQYKCQTCNPDIIIEISGSLLASSLYEELGNSQQAKTRIQQEIRDSQQGSFAITTAYTSSIL